MPILLIYKDQTLDCGFRAGMIFEGKFLVEVKAVAALVAIQKAQALPTLFFDRHGRALARLSGEP